HLAPARPERERDLADGVLPPLARRVARDELDVDARLGVLGVVIRSQSEDRRRRAPADVDAAGLRLRVADVLEVFRQETVERRDLRRKERRESVVAGLRDRRLEGGA